MKKIVEYLNEGLRINKDTSLNKMDYKSYREQHTCAFNPYEDVTQEMVDEFWSKERYAKKLVDKKDIRKEWQDAYDKAKKNTAMLDYAMHSSYSVYFDKEANLNILINSGGSYSSQNHLHHYASKCRKYFRLSTAAFSVIDKEKWELLLNGRKEVENK